MERRLLYIPMIHIDANLINSRQKLREISQLERWYEDGVILINMSSTAHGEAKAGGDAKRVRKANSQIFTATDPHAENDPLFKEVVAALFPKGPRNENEKNDVRIVCEAAKYQAILVTGDGASKTQPGGILGNRAKLKNVVNIVSPQEAVTLIRQKIAERDDFNKRVAREVGGELPPWTCKD